MKARKTIRYTPTLRELRALLNDPNKLREVRAAAKRDRCVIWLQLP